MARLASIQAGTRDRLVAALACVLALAVAAVCLEPQPVAGLPNETMAVAGATSEPSLTAGAAGAAGVASMGVIDATPTATADATPTLAATGTPQATARPAAEPTAGPAGTLEPPTAWTIDTVAPRKVAADEKSVQAHLGANFPVLLTSRTEQVDGAQWRLVAWQTPSRSEFGWVPNSSLSETDPKATASAGLDALNASLQQYVQSLGSRIGVQVYDVTRGVTYGYNANKQFIAASSMKVPIMLTLLSQLEVGKREPTAREMRLLTSMIEISSNASARGLYVQIGDKKGVTAYLRKIGVAGITPAKPYNGFGYSLISPAGMVSLLDKLRTGEAVTDAHRDLALRLMSSVISEQRIGVGDSSPEGAQVAMKDGWVGVNDGSGTSVMNSSGIVTVGGETYILAVYTDRDHGWSQGWNIARRVCRDIGRALVPAAKPPYM